MNSKTIPFNLERFMQSGQTLKVITHVGAKVINLHPYTNNGNTIVICQVSGEVRQYTYSGRHEGKQHLFMQVPIEFYNDYSCVVYGTHNPDAIESKTVLTVDLPKFLSDLELNGFSIFQVTDLKNV